MKYLNTKPGSIEEVAASMSKYAAESEYQDMFKKELEKAGKGIGAMTPAEKKAFFNKIDSKYKAKNEETINEKKNYKRDSNFFVNDKTDTLKKMSGRQGYNKSTLTDYLAQKSNKKENDVYFDDTDLVYKDKTVLKNAETKTVDQMLKALQKEEVEDIKITMDTLKPGVTFKEERFEVTTDIYFKNARNVVKGAKIVVDAKNKEDAEEKASDIINNARMKGRWTKPETGGNFSIDYLDNVRVTPTNKPYGILSKGREHLGAEYVPEEVEEALKDRDIPARSRYSKKGGFYYWDRPVKYNRIKKFYYHPKDAKPFPFGPVTRPDDPYEKKEMKKETHTFMTQKINQKKKSVPGEKDVIDPEPKISEPKAKMSFKEAYRKVKKEAMNTIGDANADKANQVVSQKDDSNDPDIKKPKGKTDAGTKPSAVDTSPEVEYKN